jgi:hypothetical protein
MTDPSNVLNVDDQIMIDGNGYVETDDDLYVNFSDEEAASTPRDVEPLPSGKYLCIMDEVEIAYCGPESKNPGKPYYRIRFTVVADKKAGIYVGRKCWTNAMLFSPALYTIEQIMKAIGFEGAGQAGKKRVPRAAELLDKTVMISGLYVGEQKDKKDPAKTYAPKFEPKSIFPESAWTAGTGGTATGKSGTASGTASLLS